MSATARKAGTPSFSAALLRRLSSGSQTQVICTSGRFLNIWATPVPRPPQPTSAKAMRSLGPAALRA